MKNITVINNNKDTAKVFKNIAKNNFNIIELFDAENIKDFLALSDLVVLHAPSLSENLIPTVNKIISFKNNASILVIAEKLKPDFSQPLFRLGVTDVIAADTPDEIILKRIMNLLEIPYAAEKEKSFGDHKEKSSFNGYQIIKALNELSFFIASSQKSKTAERSFLGFIKELLGVSRICFFRDKDNIISSSMIGFPEKLEKEIKNIPPQKTMTYLFKNLSLLRIEDPLKSSLHSEAVKEMKGIGICLFAPVIFNGQFLGALGINGKISGKLHGEDDINVLLTCAEKFAQFISMPTLRITEKALPSSSPKQEDPQKRPGDQQKLYMDFVRTLAMRSSHELRNALVSIKTFTQLLPKKYKSESFRKDFFNVVGNEVDHLNALVEDLLFFAQPIDLYKERKNISEIIKSISRALSREYKSINIKHVHEHDLTPETYLDEKHIRIAIRNILKNSIDAMKGEGTITISMKHYGSILPEKKPGVSIAITDTGTGIPEAIRQRVFEPFFTTKTKGLGLGLTIAQKILEAHNWELKLESSEAGTNFYIFIPPSRTSFNRQEPEALHYRDRLLDHNR